MNARIRKELVELASKLNSITTMIEDLKSDLETYAEEEQDKYDNMPESLQYSERGEAMQEAADALNDLVSRLDGSVSELYDISSDIESVTEN